MRDADTVERGSHPEGDYYKNFWLAPFTVNDASMVNFAYDDDGPITRANGSGSTFAINRAPDTGFVSDAALFVAGALSLVGAGAANWAVLVGYLVTPKRGSMIPLIGGTTAAVGVVLAPVPWLRSSWWLPLLLDPGCALRVAEHVLWVVRRRSGNQRYSVDRLSFKN